MLFFRSKAWCTLNCLDLAYPNDWYISLPRSPTASDIFVPLHHPNLRVILATIHRLHLIAGKRHSRQAKHFINYV